MSIEKRGRGRPKKSASKRRENRLDTYISDAVLQEIEEVCDERGGIPHSVLANEALSFYLRYLKQKDTYRFTA